VPVPVPVPELLPGDWGQLGEGEVSAGDPARARRAGGGGVDARCGGAVVALFAVPVDAGARCALSTPAPAPALQKAPPPVCGTNSQALPLCL
jgi:hypothetical protein